MPETRKYGVWAGRPQGIPEDTTRCIVEVYHKRSFTTLQCNRKRGFGPDKLYCKQHAKTSE